MTQPTSFENSGHIYKLRMTIYGLKQASRVWAQKLRESLTNLWFRRNPKDYLKCLYFYWKFLFLLDMWKLSFSQEEVIKKPRMFQNSYKLTDSGSKLFWVLASFKILIFEMDRCTPEMMTLPNWHWFWYKNADPTRKWRQGSISFYSQCNHVLCHSFLCQFVTKTPKGTLSNFSTT